MAENEPEVPGFGQYPGEANRNGEGQEEPRVAEVAPQVPRVVEPEQSQEEKPKGEKPKGKSDGSD